MQSVSKRVIVSILYCKSLEETVCDKRVKNGISNHGRGKGASMMIVTDSHCELHNVSHTSF